MGYHSLVQGIFPTQGSNPGFLHRRQRLYHLSHQGSPPGFSLTTRQGHTAPETLHTKSLQWCPSFCRPPGSSVHGIRNTGGDCHLEALACCVPPLYGKVVKPLLPSPPCLCLCISVWHWCTESHDIGHNSIFPWLCRGTCSPELK